MIQIIFIAVFLHLVGYYLDRYKVRTTSKRIIPYCFPFLVFPIVHFCVCRTDIAWRLMQFIDIKYIFRDEDLEQQELVAILHGTYDFVKHILHIIANIIIISFLYY